MRFGKSGVKEQVEPGGAPVPFRVPVTVTHVPGVPLFGMRFRLLRCPPVSTEWTGVGTVTEDIETKSADVNSTNRYAELTLRIGNSKHTTIAPGSGHI